jgi:NAD(P)-dependent dehydrogenase (short-subunit alcohol dehydrogenase family)
MNVLVTGGTKGIGFAIARSFAESGADIFINYHSDDVAAERAAGAIRTAGGKPHAIKCDAGTVAGCRALAESVARDTQHLDLVVHCALDAYATGTLAADPARFERAVVTNGVSLLYLVQSTLFLLRAGSSIVFLTSRGGRIVVPNYAAIGVGKALAESLLRYLAVELAPKGIRINAVAPALVDTEAVRALFGDRTPDLVRESAGSNPTGRGIRDDDYTNVVRWLASPESAFVQGQIIFVNGGANLSA